MSTATVPMSIRLEAGAREKLKQIAVRQKRSAHALATEAITQLIAEKEREYAWQQSCDEAIAHFDTTGLHLSHDEVISWVESWGKKSEKPAPICHL